MQDGYRILTPAFTTVKLQSTTEMYKIKNQSDVLILTKQT